MESLLKYLPGVVAFLVFVIDIILIIIRNAKSGKLTPKEKESVEKLEKLQEILTQVVPDAMVLAEKSGTTTGAAKKLVALSQIMLECNKKGLNYADYCDTIEQQVERNISLSKEVNV